MIPDLDVEWCYKSIADLGRAYRERVVSPVEVTEAHLRRIERLDDRLHTYITVTADAALKAAEASADRFAHSEPRGPLDGVPVGLKDLFDTAGVPTTAHSPLFASRVPQVDATVVTRLRAAGAVLLGKHSMYEFGAGRPTLSTTPPQARNPWNTELVTGGSSSGSAAALAAGLCAGAFGSDTGGSIRWPASMCGVVGLKPTYGLISRFGVIPFSWTLDHVGPIARTAEDVAILLQAVVGYDPGDPASSQTEVPSYQSRLATSVAGLRVGAPLRHPELANVDQETMEAYQAALGVFGRLGASVREIELPPEVDHNQVVFRVIGYSEALAFHSLDARERPKLYGPTFFPRLLEGALFTAVDYVQALRGRALLSRIMDNVMTSVDLIALPTSPRSAWSITQDDGTAVLGRRAGVLTHLFNTVGQPALSVPCGFSSAGLPIGLQLVGRRFEDDVLLAAAHVYQQSTDWPERRPAL